MVKGSPGTSGARPGLGDISPAMLEGFAAAKVLVEGLKRAGPKPSREKSRRRLKVCASLTWAAWRFLQPRRPHRAGLCGPLHHWHRRQVPTLKQQAPTKKARSDERAGLGPLANAAQRTTRPRMSLSAGRRGWGGRRGGCWQVQGMHSVCAVLFTAHISLVARHDDHVHRHGGKQDEPTIIFHIAIPSGLGLFNQRACLRRRVVGCTGARHKPLMEHRTRRFRAGPTPLSNDQSLA